MPDWGETMYCSKELARWYASNQCMDQKELSLSKHDFVKGINRHVMGHYNYFGIIGDGYTINRFYRWAMNCTYKCLNRRSVEPKRIFVKHLDYCESWSIQTVAYIGSYVPECV
jgi:hypothetical protein